MTDLEVVAVPSDTRLAHLDAWQLLLCGALSSSSARSEEPQHPDGVLEIYQKLEVRNQKNVHGFHMIYGDFR